MINLIKNELTKIFHKKVLYIFMIIIAAIAALNVVITKTAEVFLSDEMPEVYYDNLEKIVNSYDLKDGEQKKYYIEDKTTLEVHNLVKDYDKESWEYYVIKNKSPEIITCIITAELNKDEESKQNCEKNLEELKETAKHQTWRSYVEDEKQTSLDNIANLKELLATASTDSEKANIQKQIKIEEYNIEGYDYRLNNNIPLNSNENSHLVDAYVSSAIAYLDMNKDEKSYAKRSDLQEKRNIESEYYINKYKLENKIKEPKSTSAINNMQYSVASISFIVLIGSILIAAQIVAEEFNKGTIKQLLLRPYTRTKILASKYITVLIVFLLLYCFNYLVDIVSSGIMGGFNTLGNDIIIYNFNTHSVETMKLLQYTLINFASILPMYLTLITIAFALGTITGNTAVSICLSLAYYFGSFIMEGLLSRNPKIAALLPSQNWNFQQFLFGGLSSNEYVTLTSSIIVTCLVFIIIIVVPFIVFKRKNIKNQ